VRYSPRPMAETADEGLSSRLTRQAEDALGKLAQDLLESPLINGAITRAFDAREKAAQAQEVAMGALNLPSAADLERLTRRVRSVSQRLEGLEDGLDRLEDSVHRLGREEGIAERLERIDEQLESLTREVAAVREALPGAASPVPSSQERLEVGESQ